jgi:hypothetical protein
MLRKGLQKSNPRKFIEGSKAYLELLANKDIQAVLISSPGYTHPEFLEAAVAAGKHMYCEKPVAVAAKQRAAGSFTSSLHDANDNKVRSFINSI